MRINFTIRRRHCRRQVIETVIKSSSRTGWQWCNPWDIRGGGCRFGRGGSGCQQLFVPGTWSMERSRGWSEAFWDRANTAGAVVLSFFLILSAFLLVVVADDGFYLEKKNTVLVLHTKTFVFKTCVWRNRPNLKRFIPSAYEVTPTFWTVFPRAIILGFGKRNGNLCSEIISPIQYALIWPASDSFFFLNFMLSRGGVAIFVCRHIFFCIILPCMLSSEKII